MGLVAFRKSPASHHGKAFGQAFVENSTRKSQPRILKSDDGATIVKKVTTELQAEVSAVWLQEFEVGDVRIV